MWIETEKKMNRKKIEHKHLYSSHTSSEGKKKLVEKMWLSNKKGMSSAYKFMV